MKHIERARQLRPIIMEAVKSLDDAKASEAVELFATLGYSGKLISAGTRINWNGTIKKAAVDLWDAVENNPDNAPSLWEDISYRNGMRIIPEIITVTAAFAKGEKGWWGDDLYESTLDNNTWTPEQYSDGWVKVNE